MNEKGPRAVKRLMLLGTLLSHLLMLESCNNPIDQLRGPAQAKSGLESLVAELPNPASFNTTRIEYFHFSDSAYGKTCYYARAYLIVASSLPLPQAMDAYTERTQLSGWLLDGRQYESARSLVRGENSLLVIEAATPGAVTNAEELARLQTYFKSIILVRLEYIVPKREGC